MIATIIYGVLFSLAGVIGYVLWDVSINRYGPKIKSFAQFDIRRYWRTNQVRLILIMVAIVAIAIVARAMRDFVDQWVAMFVSTVGGVASTGLAKQVSGKDDRVTKRRSLWDTAGGYLGIKEVPGEGDNPEIIGWAKKMGFNDYKHDSTGWCALFLNWVLFIAGYSILRSLRAIDFQNYGLPATAADLGSGNCIAVFKNHVGIPEKESDDGKKIYLRGGNQSNMTNDLWFDKQKSKFVCYRKVA